MHPHPNSHHVTVHFRHALSISGRGGGGVGLRRLAHDYGAIEIDGSNSEIKFDGNDAGASANESDPGTHDHLSIDEECGSDCSRGRALLDAYGDSLKHVALMLWKQGYGMHQRKVPPCSPHPPPPTLTLLVSCRCQPICLT
jgi:hypothetical protein